MSQSVESFIAVHGVPANEKLGVSNETCALEFDAIDHKQGSVALYIDADNQSPVCASALISLLGGDSIVVASIAGNNNGKQVESWRDALSLDIPEQRMRLLNVPKRKQAADIALMMELGASLERHILKRERVVMVSRDELLINAAEYAHSRGCKVFISYADSEIPTARSTVVTTFLLPAVSKPNLSSPATPPMAPNPPSVVAAKPVTKPELQPEIRVVARLRELCKPQNGGGYGANEIGQALFKLGFETKASRTQFLKSIPGLKERGTGPNKVLVF